MPEEKQILGRVEKVDFPRSGFLAVPARVDTGAKTSSVWASRIKIGPDGKLSFCLFGKNHPLYTGKKITVPSYQETVVANSMGIAQKRYKVKLTIVVGKRKIRASFTLANRSRQVYPVLIGRNILRGKFIVDVTRGQPLREAEKKRTKELRKLFNVDMES